MGELFWPNSLCTAYIIRDILSTQKSLTFNSDIARRGGGVVWCPDSLAEKMGLHSRREAPGMDHSGPYDRREMEFIGAGLEKGSERKKPPWRPNGAGAF